MESIVLIILAIIGVPIAVLIGISVSIRNLKSDLRQLKERLDSLERGQGTSQKQSERSAAADATSGESVREDELSPGLDSDWPKPREVYPSLDPFQQSKKPIPGSDVVGQPAEARKETTEPYLPPVLPVSAAISESAEALSRSAESVPPELNPFLLARDGAEAKESPSEKMPPWVESEAIPPLVSKPKATRALDLEQFMGVKLFAWLGGLALFLATAFFIKYSLDNNLISPQLRIVIGFMLGLGLIIGGLKLPMVKSPVTVQTLCATGVVVLYTDIFAAYGLYKFIPSEMLAFLLMALVTVTAFYLAVRLNAQVVVILGLLGGFLTPVLIRSGVDRPFGLFSYIALLDIGLLAVALRQSWLHLVPLGAVGTVLMQVGWAASFYQEEKFGTALAVIAVFGFLFASFVVIAEEFKKTDKGVDVSGCAMPMVGFVFVLVLAAGQRPETILRPGLMFGVVVFLDLLLMSLAWRIERLRLLINLSGSCVFLLLGVWMVNNLTPDLLLWALGFSMVFALLHTALPLAVMKYKGWGAARGWLQISPLISLAMLLIPIVKLAEPFSWAVWIVVLLLNALALGVGLLLMSVVSILGALMLTFLGLGAWLMRLKPDTDSMPLLLAFIVGFALLFFFAGGWVARSAAARSRQDKEGGGQWLNANEWLPEVPPEVLVPIVSGLMPFILLSMVLTTLPVLNPTPVFGVALLMSLLLLGLVRLYRVDVLALVALAGVILVQVLWHFRNLHSENAWIPLGWQIAFGTLFTLFPFVVIPVQERRVMAWVSSAIAFVLHFFLMYRTLGQLCEGTRLGFLPALLAFPMLAGTLWLIRQLKTDHPDRLSVLAWFGGATLFFITFIFPIQFSKHWLTLGWALEGAALIWLFCRLPHPGLRWAGLGLLGVVFVRLGLNLEVAHYYPFSGRSVLNWFLYTYGVAIACFMYAGRLLAPPRNLLRDVNVPPVLFGMGTILAFVLLNIEIAVCFNKGESLTFHLSSSLGQDMTYSLAWGVFAFVVLVVGIRKDLIGARYGGLGLLTVSMLKLFLHDLWRLRGLYRVGSLVGLAIVLIVVSYIYQRFFINKPKAGEADSNPD